MSETPSLGRASALMASGTLVSRILGLVRATMLVGVIGGLARRQADHRPVGLVVPPPDPSITRIDGPWRHWDIHANGIRFHVVEAVPAGDGPPTARPLVMLLHGFGSFWWTWRHQLRGLSGVRVVAVDLRGYGGSDKPPRGYDGWTLAGDTAGLIRALGHSSATLVGHADGGLVCWATALLHPRLVRDIAVVSSPHPAALRRSALTHADQGRALLPWPVVPAPDAAAIKLGEPSHAPSQPRQTRWHALRRSGARHLLRQSRRPLSRSHGA